MTIDELKAQIDSTIKSNGQRLITGAQLNSILNAIATYTAEVEGVSLKVPQFLPFDSIITNADVQVGSTSATDYEIVYVESKNVFTAYTGGVYYTDWVGSLSYNKGTFSKSAIATNLYINPYAEIYKIENSKLVAIQKHDIANVVATYGDGLATLSYKGSAIYPETKGSQVKLSIGGNADDAIKQNSSNIVKEKERAKQVEMYLESQKANKYGYYEGLSVGVSDNLSGRGEATDSEFTMRPSGGKNKSIQDGTARINTIKGNSVVWNQLFKHGSGSWSVNTGITILFNNSTLINKADSFEFTVNNEFTSRIWVINQTTPNLFLKGRKYAIILNIKSNVNEITQLRFYTGADNIALDYSNGNYKSFIYTPSADSVDYTALITMGSSTFPAGTYIKGRVDVVDLTKMLNGINEPTTVEEFESLYGNMPNEYNEGDIIDNHTSAIKSVGVNAWDGVLNNGLWRENGRLLETSNWNGSANPIRILGGADYYISFTKTNAIEVVLYDSNMGYIKKEWREPNKVYRTPSNAHFLCINNAQYNSLIPEDNDICVHLVHTGYLNGKYFPYESQTRQLPTVEGGLKSAGTAYDEIRYNKSKDKWEHVQRVGSVDLGKLDFEIRENSVFRTDGIEDRLRTTIFNAISSKYKVNKQTTPTIDYVINSNDDKFIRAYYLESNLSNSVYVKDSDYTDVATFKEAMQGVILNYELATPIVTELDVDISPDYKVWDYGTEEAISEVLSTPVRINSNYGFNAVGQITDNTELIKELLARVAVLEAQVAQANSANVEPIEPVVE